LRRAVTNGGSAGTAVRRHLALLADSRNQAVTETVVQLQQPFVSVPDLRMLLVLYALVGALVERCRQGDPGKLLGFTQYATRLAARPNSGLYDPTLSRISQQDAKRKRAGNFGATKNPPHKHCGAGLCAAKQMEFAQIQCETGEPPAQVDYRQVRQ